MRKGRRLDLRTAPLSCSVSAGDVTPGRLQRSAISVYPDTHGALGPFDLLHENVEITIEIEVSEPEFHAIEIETLEFGKKVDADVPHLIAQSFEDFAEFLEPLALEPLLVVVGYSGSGPVQRREYAILEPKCETLELSHLRRDRLGDPICAVDMDTLDPVRPLLGPFADTLDSLYAALDSFPNLLSTPLGALLIALEATAVPFELHLRSAPPLIRGPIHLIQVNDDVPAGSGATASMAVASAIAPVRGRVTHAVHETCHHALGPAVQVLGVVGGVADPSGRKPLRSREEGRRSEEVDRIGDEAERRGASLSGSDRSGGV